MTPQCCCRYEPIARTALINPTVASSMTAEVGNTQQKKKNIKVEAAQCMEQGGSTGNTAGFYEMCCDSLIIQLKSCSQIHLSVH